jgi:S1-C subfamily serine protease
MTSEEKQRVRIIQRALPAVVSIATSQHIQDIRRTKPEMFPVTEQQATRSPAQQPQEQETQDFGSGSGFIAHASGIVVTNIHVLGDIEADFSVLMADGTVYPAELIGTNPINDVAFLRIRSDRRRFPCLKLGSSSSVKLGQTVYAIGNVLGLFKNTVTSGIISGLSRSISASNETIHESLKGVIQTDAAINPGNSGGPLLDSAGKVIGISSAAIARAANIGFAVPIDTIKNDLGDVISCGKIRRAFLGVRYVPVTQEISQALKLPVQDGILVTSPAPSLSAVIRNSPAYKAGVKSHDIITSIGGRQLTAQFTLEDYLESAQGGQTATLHIVRDSSPLTLEVTLQEKA